MAFYEDISETKVGIIGENIAFRDFQIVSAPIFRARFLTISKLHARASAHFRVGVAIARLPSIKLLLKEKVLIFTCDIDCATAAPPDSIGTAGTLIEVDVDGDCVPA